MRLKKLIAFTMAIVVGVIFIIPINAQAATLSDNMTTVEYDNDTGKITDRLIFESYCWGSASGGIFTQYSIDVDLNGFFESWAACDSISYSGSIQISGLKATISSSGVSVSGNASNSASFSGSTSDTAMGLSFSENAHANAIVATSVSFVTNASYSYKNSNGRPKSVHHTLSDSCVIW